MRGSKWVSAVIAVGLLSVVPVGVTPPAAGLITVSSDVTITSGVVPVGDPTLALNRLIETAPFVGTSVSVRDNEGSAYVPIDNSLWIVSDNDSAAFAVDPDTGALRRTVAQSAFAAAPEADGRPAT